MTTTTTKCARRASAGVVALVVVALVVVVAPTPARGALTAFPPLPLPCEQNGTNTLPAPPVDQANITISYVYWAFGSATFPAETTRIALEYFVDWANAKGGVTIGAHHHWFELRAVRCETSECVVAASMAIACDRSVTLNYAPPDFIDTLPLTSSVLQQAKFQLGTLLQIPPFIGRDALTLSPLSSVKTGVREPLRLLTLVGARRLMMFTDTNTLGVECLPLLGEDDLLGFDAFSAMMLENHDLPSVPADEYDALVASQRANATATVDAAIDAEARGTLPGQSRSPGIDVLLVCGLWDHLVEVIVDRMRERGWYPPAVLLYPHPLGENITVQNFGSVNTAVDDDDDDDEHDDDEHDDDDDHDDGRIHNEHEDHEGHADLRLQLKLPAYFSTLAGFRPFVGTRYFDEHINGTGDDWAVDYTTFAAEKKAAVNLTNSVATFDTWPFIAGEMLVEALQRLTSLDDVHRAPTMRVGAERLMAAMLGGRSMTFVGPIGFTLDGIADPPLFIYQSANPDVTDLIFGLDAEREIAALPNDERIRRFSSSGDILSNGEYVGSSATALVMRTVSPISAASGIIAYPMPAANEREWTGGWWSEGSEVALGVITVLVMLSAVACGVAMAVLRHNKVMLASSLMFNTLFLVGALLALSTNFVWMLYTNDAACQARPWLLGLGLSLMFGALLCKTWRVFRLFRALKNVNAQRETGLYVLAAVIVAVELLFLAIWTGVAPLRAEFRVPQPLRPSTAYYECEGDNLVAWSAAQVALLGLILVVNVVMTFLIRHVKMVCFNESRYIIFSVYNMFTLGIILVALQYSQAVDREPLYILRSVLVLFAVGVSVWVLFFSKFWLIYKKVELTTERSSHHSSGKQSRGATGGATSTRSPSVSRMSPSGSVGSTSDAASQRSSTLTPDGASREELLEEIAALRRQLADATNTQ